MDVKQFIRSMETKLKIRLFSLEYQLILGMYDHGPMHTVTLQRWSEISPRSFHYTLHKLVSSGLVYKTNDEDDQRRKLNCLHGWVSDTLDQVHAELKQWSEHPPAQ